MSDDKVIYLFKDKKYEDFYQSLLDFIYENAEGLLFPAVIGCMDMAKMSLMNDQIIE